MNRDNLMRTQQSHKRVTGKARHSTLLLGNHLQLFVPGLISASALCWMNATIHAQNTVISGTNTAPAGATDVDFQYKVNNLWEPPNWNFVDGSNSLGGNSCGTATGSGYTAAVHMPLGNTALSTPGNVSWSVTLTGGSDYFDKQMWFTTNGNAIPGTEVNIASLEYQGGNETYVAVSIPSAASYMTITNFALYANQDPSLANNVTAFMDFSTLPFNGCAVSGIPSNFALSSYGNNSTVLFSVENYLGLATPADMAIGWTADINGYSFRGLEESIPEPSAFALFGLGLIGLLTRRRRGIAPSKLARRAEHWNRRSGEPQGKIGNMG